MDVGEIHGENRDMKGSLRQRGETPGRESAGESGGRARGLNSCKSSSLMTSESSVFSTLSPEGKDPAGSIFMHDRLQIRWLMNLRNV